VRKYFRAVAVQVFGEVQSCAGMAHELRQLVLSGFNRLWPQVFVAIKLQQVDANRTASDFPCRNRSKTGWRDITLASDLQSNATVASIQQVEQRIDHYHKVPIGRRTRDYAPAAVSVRAARNARP
jgi:hypothetical protein